MRSANRDADVFAEMPGLFGGVCDSRDWPWDLVSSGQEPADDDDCVVCSGVNLGSIEGNAEMEWSFGRRSRILQAWSRAIHAEGKCRIGCR